MEPGANEFYEADLSIRSKMGFLTLIKSKLSENAIRDTMFRETCFGHWLDIPYTDNEPGLVNLILQTQIPVDQNLHEEYHPLVYNVRGFELEFGREQFCLITGLLFGPMNWLPYSRGDIPFKDRVFRSFESKSVTLRDFTNLFHSDRFADLRDEDAIRVCLVICLELIFTGREHTCVVSKYLLRLVEDLNAWNGFAWGSYVWSNTYTSLKNAKTRMDHQLLKAGQLSDNTTKPKMPKLTFTGFFWAFKIWILETFAPHVRCWEHDYSIIPRALGWKKISMFHVKEDGVELLSSIHNLRPPIHPLQPKDNERAQEWYILSSAYLNRFPRPTLGVNQNVQVHPRPTVPTTEERLLALELLVHSELLNLKDRVSTLEQKVQKEEDDDWLMLDELLDEHKKHMEEKNEEVVDRVNVGEVHNLEGLCSSANELGRKFDRIEVIVDPVDTRMRSVYSYLSDPCDDVLVDNLVLEDTAYTGIGLCPKPPPVKEEAVYILNKSRLGEILTRSDKQKPFTSEEEFKKSHHYQRFRADLEARKRKSSFPWNSANLNKPSTHDEDEKFTAFKRGKPVEITRASLPGYTKKEFNKLKTLVQSYMPRPVTPWIEYIGDGGIKVREVDVYVSQVELTENVEKTPDPPFKFPIKTKQEKASCSKRLFE